MAKQTDWERWVLDHAPGLLLFARQQSRCEADAQDLVQEAVVEVWLRQADGAPPPVAVVFATIRRRAADWGRRQDRRAAREAAARAEKGAGKEVTWLGLSAEESSDALTSQLGLQAGEGLLVTYVATNSPAAKASLQKNDLLIEMDGQELVLPEQLRKLVQMRKEGDQVVLTYYRGGKKQSTTATLGKTKAGFGLFGDGGHLDGLKQLRVRLKDLSTMDGLNDHLSELREELARAGVDRKNIEVEVRRGVEQARKAIAAAVAQVHGTRGGAPAVPEALEDLARGGVEVDKDATVTIKSRTESVRSMVKTDDTGTYVIVANPKKRLTAHDKDGKLAFDGEIETSEQQQKVPKDVWKEVQPMIEQLNQTTEDAPAVEPAPKKTSALPPGGRRLHNSQVLADLRTFAAMMQYLFEPEYPVPATVGTNGVAAGTGRGFRGLSG
jgi:DNA-directed RNA polymerase specialized sigma24 family protein